MSLRSVCGVGLPVLVLAFSVSARAQQNDDPMLLYDENGLRVRAHLQLGANAVMEQNVFWNFSDIFAPTAGYDATPQWLEGYLKGGISFTHDLADSVELYGKVTGVASGTLGIDAFGKGNTGRITLEEAYAGLRARMGGDAVVDVSLGPRELVLGTGMLIANGGANGFERGSLKLGPRKAWERAAIGRVEVGRFTTTGFLVDANELSASDSGTEIAGLDMRFDWDGETYLGGTYGYVPASTSPYPRAATGGFSPPVILDGARKGLNFINLYGRTNLFSGRWPGFFLAGDFAYEWNERIDLRAWAGRVQVGYTFEDTRWRPMIAYSYQTFSGDDPATARLERFDPLYYQGSPSAWSTGSKSSMAFLNSNVSAHQVMLRITPTRRDTVTLRYAHILANELFSPLQFGQGTRLVFDNSGNPHLVSGVARSHLADDVYLEYNRALSKNTYLTAGAGISFPGKGLRSASSGNADYWSGAFVNLVSNF